MYAFSLTQNCASLLAGDVFSSLFNAQCLASHALFIFKKRMRRVPCTRMHRTSLASIYRSSVQSTNKCDVSESVQRWKTPGSAFL
ncbi:uncharacterized protein PHACADRAFT_252825 [Phanerochaete carnosa HHB-10118-sp]|uniref:Uncharacterized protein n=1 Tax=Phanerochaete carnosa (strain HHB-10118-sp) TaxID=650164 RepID=K5V6X0_PHACS|nr:uncharacterized protein PHACADRAFT_252825 [Phanerochaete carnosa HHB-10118-sp]EKM58476.1 hypothetical protein PHACADRAFT_252825 [Phanerochaete carnosa HHB-10118-sp]